MLSREGTGGRAGQRAGYRPDQHHEDGHHGEVREHQAADSTGYRAGERALPQACHSTVLWLTGIWHRPGSHEPGRDSEQARHRGDDQDKPLTVIAAPRCHHCPDREAGGQTDACAGEQGHGRYR